MRASRAPSSIQFPGTTLLPFRLFGSGAAHGLENVVWDAGADDAIEGLRPVGATEHR
jgi:hypothetical protein